MQAVKTKRYPLVEVVWLDAWFRDIYIEDPDSDTCKKHRPVVVKDCGYMLSRTKAGVTIAMCGTEENNFRHIGFIPAGMIKSVRELK